MLIAARQMVQGAQISAPLGRYSSAVDVLEALGTAKRLREYSQPGSLARLLRSRISILRAEPRVGAGFTSHYKTIALFPFRTPHCNFFDHSHKKDWTSVPKSLHYNRETERNPVAQV